MTRQNVNRQNQTRQNVAETVRSHKNVGPIGLAVLMFIGYKQTSKQTDRQTNKVHLVNKTKTSNLGDFIKKFRGFSKFSKIEF